MGSRVQGDRDAQIRRSREWESRPGLSRAVRAVVFAGPVAASLGVAAVLSHLLPRADGPATTALWVTVIALASLLTLVLFERAAQRLLPLATLLNLSLIFPDKAPARFAVARRTGRPRDLQQRLRQAHTAGDDDDATRMQTVIELVLALSVHDKASRGHSERVRVFTDLLAEQLKIPTAERNRLRWAALLHDIGKLEVPAAILTKPGLPTTAEWATLHRHPEEGARLVAPLMPWLGEWGKAVVEHHERFDGTGYPHQLKGHQISLAARIVAVADSYEVMTAPRPYKRSMNVAAARRELVRVAGTQLDPAIVRAFLNVSVGRLWRTIGFGAWIAQVPQLARLSSVGGWSGSGLGMGIATATTATILATVGVIGPTPPPASPTVAAQAVALAPSPTPPPPPPRAPATPWRGSVSVTQPPVSTPTGGSAPTAQPSPSAATSVPSPTASSSPPTATPKPTPVATQKPTPAPTPVPSTCTQCTNASSTCTSYCNNNSDALCTAYCQGNNNKVCTSHCFGNNNSSCLTDCQGTNNPKCHTLCRAAVVQASLLSPAAWPPGAATAELVGMRRPLATAAVLVHASGASP